MAVLPAKNAGKGLATSGARFRQRKISVKVSLPIYKQRDLSNAESDLEPSQVHHLNQSATQQQRDLHTIETGVDKNEEDEVHLQQVINAAQKALLGHKSSDDNTESEKKKSVYIPTPDASKIWKEAERFYRDSHFTEPDTYIKFSATVEDTVGVEYNMDEEDDEFFQNVLTKEYPKKSDLRKAKSNVEPGKCTETEFEVICDKFEKIIEQKQPFLSVDPSNILGYDELSSILVEEEKNSSKLNKSYIQLDSNLKYLSTSALKERLSKEINYKPFETLFDKNPLQISPNDITRPIPKLLELFGKPIYEHWRARKIARKGKYIHPLLKFEDPNASEKDNDNDPYICFRRREFRQARKTRRADTLGAERIRLLQKSLHRARNLISSVCQREILKLQSYESENQIFKLRSEAKGVKRAVGVKGDDHLFYPHKRKKIHKIKEIEEDSEVPTSKIKSSKRSRLDGRDEMPSKERYTNGHHHQLQAQQVQAQEASSTQPYVKLPPSKIPDMDLVTVSLVLKGKNETIKRAVLEKLRKRSEQDKGFINVTDDPFQPFFNISTNDKIKNKELSHMPYSSIAASSYHQINTTNFINENLKKMLEDGQLPLPGMKTFKGSNGELIPCKPFPHLLTLLENHLNGPKSDSSYVAQLLSNIEANNFSAYSNGYGSQQRQQQHSSSSSSSLGASFLSSHDSSSSGDQSSVVLQQGDDDSEISDPVFRLRKRIGRFNRQFVDRRGLVERPKDVIDEFLKFDDENVDAMEVDSESQSKTKSKVPNVYDSKVDTIKRLDSRWKFDNDYTEYQKGIKRPFSLDPSRLNCISDDTQSIRFGSMLLSKSYDLLRESVHQRQLLIQQARMRVLQQQQQHLANRNGAHGVSNQARLGATLPNKGRIPPPTAVKKENVSASEVSTASTNGSTQLPNSTKYNQANPVTPSLYNKTGVKKSQVTPRKPSYSDYNSNLNASVHVIPNGEAVTNNSPSN